MSKKATEFQKKEMSKMYRGKGIFKPLNTGWVDEHVACVREWVANIFFYRRMCYAFYRLMCATPLGKICASDHAMSAVDEMSALNRELKAYFEKVGAPYETWKQVEKTAAKYLE